MVRGRTVGPRRRRLRLRRSVLSPVDGELRIELSHPFGDADWVLLESRQRAVGQHSVRAGEVCGQQLTRRHTAGDPAPVSEAVWSGPTALTVHLSSGALPACFRTTV